MRTLRNAIETEQIRQAYLFAGPRGTEEDVAREDPREGAQLRSGADDDPRRHLPLVRRDRERDLAGRDRDGRSFAAWNRRHPRDPRTCSPAGRGALQGLHPRRGAPADDAAFNALLKLIEEPRPTSSSSSARPTCRRCSRPSARDARRLSSRGRGCRPDRKLRRSPKPRASRRPTQRSRSSRSAAARTAMRNRRSTSSWRPPATR